MDYEVTLYLNEDGQKVTGLDKKVIMVSYDKSIESNDDLRDAIIEVFPAMNLIDKFEVNKSLPFLKVNDIVEIHNPFDDEIIIGEIKSITKRKGQPEYTVITRTQFGSIDHWEHRYNSNGKEIGPKAKNKWWITEANEENKKTYEELCNYGNMLEDISERCEMIPDDYYEDRRAGVKYLDDLTADQLKRILDIFNE